MNFADAWYDLHNAELLDEEQQMVVTFETNIQDYPPNVKNLVVKEIILYFSPRDGQAHQIENIIERVHLKHIYTEMDAQGQPVERTPEETADPINGKISTREGAWSTLNTGQVTGQWTLSLRPDDNDLQKADKLKALAKLFKEDEAVQDILFVISYEGERPPWPANQ
jgi:hypothetical protein